MPRATLCLDCGRAYWPPKKGRCPDCQKAKDSADYYQSAKWRRIAREAKARAGYSCVICGSRVRLIAHHGKPRKEGGPDTQDNIFLLCGAGAIRQPWESCHSQYEADRRSGKNTQLRQLVEAL